MAEEIDPFIQWLKKGLKKHGKTQSGLARHLGLDPSAVNRMVNGGRDLKSGEISKIAGYLDEPAPEFVRSLVPIVGHVGANPDGTILYAEGYATGDVVPPAPGASSSAVAVYVAGHSMRGFADDGSIIYYEDRRDPPTEDMLGQIVVVGLNTGEVMLKRLLRGSSPGLFDLESIAGPTRRDAIVEWACHVAAVVPPWKARQIVRHFSDF